MSISPQSLARTRDKRHPRTPARFDDFIPLPSTSNISNTTTKLDESVTKKCRPFHPSITKASLKSSAASLGNEMDIDNKEALENLNLDIIAPPKVSSTPSTSNLPITTTKPDDSVTKPDESVIKPDESVTKKCSPFHPSITISNGVNFKGPKASEPLIEKKPSAPANTNTPTNVSLKSSSSSRKKTKGLSLMIRTSPNGPYHDVNNPQLVQRQVPQSQQMRYSNLNQNMQYGSRLMLNEPIHLPKSVSTIAPITATLQQIANQARKPPFITKKAEAYIAYQEARKFDYMLSIQKALTRITETLDYQDLLNLRKVNKTWRSVINSDTVWKKVSLKRNLEKDTDYRLLVNNLTSYKTKELTLESINPYLDECSTFINVLCTAELALKKISIKSVDKFENRFAMELLCALNKDYCRKMTIIWKVKVVVDDLGLALVPIQCRKQDFLNNPLAKKFYCYTAIERLISESDEIVLLELSELEELFNRMKKGKSGSKYNDKPDVHIKPI